MKKICINKIATCIFSLTLFLGSISVVGAIVYRDAIDTYKYDQNIYTEVTSNFGEYTYVKIPEPSRLTNQWHEIIARGWNYNRILVHNYYSIY